MSGAERCRFHESVVQQAAQYLSSVAPDTHRDASKLLPFDHISVSSASQDRTALYTRVRKKRGTQYLIVTLVNVNRYLIFV